MSVEDRLERIPSLELIREIKIGLERKWMDFFRKRGYQFQSPIPLIPGEIDPTVTFTGATINGFKGYLTGGREIPNPGIFTVQPCLRTQNARWFYRFLAEKTPQFGSYFRMAGLLSPPDRLEEVVKEAREFLCNVAPEGSIIIHASTGFKTHEMSDLVDRLSKEDGVKLLFDEIEYFNWRYGLPEIFGEGITFHLSCGRRKPEEIGNVVLIYSPYRPKAIEWGFGVETTTARVLGLPHPIYASDAYRAAVQLGYIPEKQQLSPGQILWIDTVNVIAVLLLNDVSLNDSRQRVRMVFQKYLRALSFFSAIWEYLPEKTTNLIAETMRLVKGEPTGFQQVVPKEIAGQIMGTYDRFGQFLSSVKQILSNPGYSDDKKRRVIERSAQNNGFTSDQLDVIIHFNPQLQELFSKKR